MILRTPNDPSWYQGGLWNDSMRIDIPGLWLMTWYDVSVAPNLAAYNYVRKTASPTVASKQYAIIAPVTHCGYKRAAEHSMVGERDMGDARLDYDALTYAGLIVWVLNLSPAQLTSAPWKRAATSSFTVPARPRRAWRSAAPSTSLYVSSDAKDTDFTVKLVELLPDGTAYNIDENIQRVRYREGYDTPPVWMEKDQVYKVTLRPMENQQLLRSGAPIANRSQQQQLPPLRSQPQLWGRQLQRITRRNPPQPSPPFSNIPPASP